MNSSGLLSEVKKKPRVVFLVITVHFVLIVLLGINLSDNEVHKQASPDKKTVKAFIVDTAKIEAEANKQKQIENNEKKQALAKKEKVKQQLQDKKNRLVAIKKKQEDEKKRLEKLKKKNAEAEKKQAAEKKRKQEILEAKRKKNEEQRRKEDAAELQRSLAEEDRLEAEALLAKERNAKLQSLRSQYVRMIELKVERNWLRPVTSNSSMSCEIIVTQTSLGDVIDVSLRKCVNDLAFQRSIERAVWKASPLPAPPSPEVFDREIHFTFKPHN